MKISKAQSQANRARIVETAAALFRERGYDGVGVADLMAAAGLTHGGFYKHFDSKADLMVEAATCGLARTSSGDAPLDPKAFLGLYLSREHRDAPADGCTLAALCGDAARQSGPVKAVFAAGLERMMAPPEGGNKNEPGHEKAGARARRLALIAQAVGAVMLSRACPDDSPLVDEILEVCRNAALKQIGKGGG